MKKKILFLIILILTVFLSQCTFDNAREYYSDLKNDPNTECDTADVSFAYDVFPIIADNCIACHNDEVHYKDRNYDTYNGIMEVVNAGLILNVINHNEGYPAMPYQKDKLSDCNIKIIEAWINQGSKNN